eukprot:364521-Chlamydomonas_euryale.AAC.9
MSVLPGRLLLEALARASWLARAAARPTRSLSSTSVAWPRGMAAPRPPPPRTSSTSVATASVAPAPAGGPGAVDRARPGATPRALPSDAVLP